MKVVTSRFYKVCDAEYCILLTNKKVLGLTTDWYLCKEHLSDERVEELDVKWLTAA